jgi:hypothetical protein
LLEVAVITIKQTNIVTLVLTCSSNLRHNLSVNTPNDQVNTVELVLHVTVGHWSNCEELVRNEFGKTEPMKTLDGSNQSEKNPALVFFIFKIHHFFSNSRSERTYCWLFLVLLAIYHPLFKPGYFKTTLDFSMFHTSSELKKTRRGF